MDPSAYELQHVHAVYDSIAPHFSSTRYKAWPTPQAFLASLPPGSVGIDVGCGNGKYLSVNSGVYILGSDRAAALVEFAARGHARARSEEESDAKGGSVTRTGHAEALVADSLALPHPRGMFDFALSIAVVHHFSTRERRVASVRELLEALTPAKEGGEGGRALIVVWALEQESSRRGWKQGDKQDVMVPWVLNEKTPRKPGAQRNNGPAEQPAAMSGNGKPTVYERYYHLYQKGELQEDVQAAGGSVLELGYEKDNWWCTATKSKRSK